MNVWADFEHIFVSGYTTSVVNTLSWQRVAVSTVRYMHNIRDGIHVYSFG